MQLLLLKLTIQRGKAKDCIAAFLAAVAALVTLIAPLFPRALALTMGTAVAGTALTATKQAEAQFPQVAPTPYVGLPAISQRDPNWKNDSLGNSNYAYTIGSDGCVITDLSTKMSWYGVSTTPRQMNEWLRDHGGYPTSGTAAQKASVIWSVAAGRAPNVVYIGANYWRTVAADLNVVNAEIDNGYPVTTEVRMGGYVHYVEMVGRTADSKNYYVIDPWDGQRKTLCPAFGPNPGAAIYSIQKYHLTDVGKGSTGLQRRNVIDAFYRAGIGQGGGRDVFQTALNSMHTVGPVAMQDFTGQRALVDISGGQVYGVYGAIGATWFAWGNVWGPIGRPRSDEFDASPSFGGTRGRGQRYDNGSIYYAVSYGSNPVLGNISRTYESYGGTGGRFGFPTGSRWPWNGYTRHDFEGGCILMDQNGNCTIYWW